MATATATATAICGWCKSKNLVKVPTNGYGIGLEGHTVPGTRKQCEGQATAPGYQKREKR